MTRIISLLNKHRKYVWIAVIIASYALLGFFLAPWLVKKYAVEAYGEMYAAELRLPEVRRTGGALRWPDQTVSIESLSIDYTLVSIFQDQDTVLNNARRSGAKRMAGVTRRFRDKSPCNEPGRPQCPTVRGCGHLRFQFANQQQKRADLPCRNDCPALAFLHD